MNRSFRVCGILNSRSLGDFTSQLFFLNTIAAQFDQAQATLIYRPDTSFKAQIASLLPNSVLIQISNEADLPSLEIFNADYQARSLASRNEEWFKNSLFMQDFVLIDGMTFLPGLSSFEHYGYLVIPKDQIPQMDAELLSLGLKPDNWFSCIHYREAGYKYKPSGQSLRDSPPANYQALSDYIIDRLGGQVVRLGHPQMTEFSNREGFVDLARLDDSVMLQAYAVSRSRFVVAGPSGASQLAQALDVPLGLTDAVDYWTPIHARDAIRTVDVISPSGELFNQRKMLAAGISKKFLINAAQKGEKYQIIKNSPRVLARMADYLYDTTYGEDKWRLPRPPSDKPRPNQFVWPRESVIRYHFI